MAEVKHDFCASAGQSSARVSRILMLDSRHKSGYGRRNRCPYGPPSREQGSSAPSMRTLCAPVVERWRACSPRRLIARALRRSASARRARTRMPPSLIDDRDRRRRTCLHAEPSARGPRARCPRGRQACRLREAARHRCRWRAAPCGARRGHCCVRRRAVRLPLLPHGARGASPDRLRARAAPCTSCTAPTCRTGCSSAEDDNWRVDPALGGASRAFADIGSHWCDLAEFVTGHRVDAPERSHRRPPCLHAFAGEDREAFARGDGDGLLRPVSTEDAVVVQFETDGGSARLGRDQPDLRRPQEPAVARGRRRPRKRSPSTRRTRSRCGSAIVTSPRSSAAIPASLSPQAARIAVLPAGHPQGYQDCFNLFVADVVRGDRDRLPARRAPDASRTDCARRGSPRPCSRRPARSAGSTSPRRRYPREAGLPHRLHARAIARGHRCLGRRQRLRRARARGLAGRGRPPLRGASHRGRRVRRGRGRPRASRARRTTA